MITKSMLAAASLSVAALLYSAANAQEHPSPRYEYLQKYRDAGENPYYHVNRYGYGNYVEGPNGRYGGYPAGSAGARELQINHELKCRYTPESC